MNLQTHFIVSLLLSVVFFPFVGYAAILILLGGFFMDVDHYLYHVVKKKKLSIIKAYSFFDNKKLGFHHVLCVFHTFEFVMLVFLLGFFSKYLKLIAIGVIVHFTMDLIYTHKNRNLRDEMPALSLIARFVKRIK